MHIVGHSSSRNQSAVRPWNRYDIGTFFQMTVVSFPLICLGILLSAYKPLLFFISILQNTSWSTLFSEKMVWWQSLQNTPLAQSLFFSEFFLGILAGIVIALLRFIHFRFYSPHPMTTIPESVLSALFCREIFTQGWKFIPLFLLNIALGIFTTTTLSAMGMTSPFVHNATPIAQLALCVRSGGGPDGVPALNLLSFIVILFVLVVLLAVLISLALHLMICWPILLLSALREGASAVVSEIYAGHYKNSLRTRLFSALGQGILNGIFSGMILGIFQSVSIAIAFSAWANPVEVIFLLLSIPWSLSLIFNAYLHPERLKSAFRDLFERIKIVLSFVFGCLLYLGIGATVIYGLHSC
jgi:hypothetical protein